MSNLIDKVMQLKDDIKARIEESCTCGLAEDADMICDKSKCRTCELGDLFSLDMTELIHSLTDLDEDETLQKIVDETVYLDQRYR